MISRVKIISFAAAGLLCSLVGFRSFLYFTHTKRPQFDLVGIQQDGTYKGRITSAISANNSYKISSLNLTLDGKPFNVEGASSVGLSTFNLPLNLDTKDLSDGEHTLSIKAIDSSYNANETTKSWNFNVDNNDLKAAFLQSEYKVDQGRTIHLKINANKKIDQASVTFLSQEYELFPESDSSTVYECFIPVGCEEAGAEHLVSAQLQDKVGNNLELTTKAIVNEYPFQRAAGFAVSKEHLEKEEDVSISDKVFEGALEKWASVSPKEKFWSGSFELPITVRKITTPFGEIRTTAEKGRYLHKAVDLINLPKSVVWASQAGKVVIRDRFRMFGNTVVVDHGHGVQTLYCHLDDFAPGLEIGDMVKKGNPLGRIGKTGYASGYHLHWELRINNVAVDPLQWTERTF